MNPQRQRHLTFAVPQTLLSITDECAVESDDDADPIKAGLDAVNKELCRPGFLKNLTASRLPSQAASDASVSPGEGDAGRRNLRLKLKELGTRDSEKAFADPLVRAEASAILTFAPQVDGSISALNAQVCRLLEASFIHARKAFTKMGSTNPQFQPFQHGHEDLVLAVDFNYFGTHLVTASSDQRLRVWERKGEEYVLVDNWRAHDAEIVDVSLHCCC
jgi:nucleoporin SEH1